MSTLTDVHVKNELESNLDYGILGSVPFWLCLISNVLSILCCCFILYYLLFDRTLRNALHNHIIIVLLFICLIYELTDIPCILYYYYFDIPWQTTPILYRFWSFADIGLYTTALIIFSWGTIERHILVFHDSWISTEKKRLYIHYLPIIILPIYCLVWYSVTILFPSCVYLNNQSNSSSISYPCLLHHPIIKYVDLIFHQVIPSLVIIAFSGALLLRSQWKRTSLSQTDESVKQRKMIIQIFSISLLYFIFCGPWAFVLISCQVSFLENIGLTLMPYAYFLSYYFIFLLPFVCCASLSEVRMKMKNFFCLQRS